MVPSQIAIQKQLSRGVLKKKFFDNMQQIYRRTHLPTCGLNKAAMLKFIVNVEHILHTVMMLPLLNLNKQMPAGVEFAIF